MAVMLSEKELRKLKELAKEKDLPPSTVAYGFVARGLKRRK